MKAILQLQPSKPTKLPSKIKLLRKASAKTTKGIQKSEMLKALRINK